MNYNLTIKQNHKEKNIRVTEGRNLLKVLQENDIFISAHCGGRAHCGKCKVKVISCVNKISWEEKKLLSPKEINNKIRLACLTKIRDNLKIKILKEKDKWDIVTGRINEEGKIAPKVRKVAVDLNKLTTNHQQDILEKIYDKVEADKIKFEALKQLDLLNKNKGFTVMIKGNEILDIQQEDRQNEQYGIAVDVGTTTIILCLIDLTTGKKVDSFSLHNPQSKFGTDIISRVQYISNNWSKIKKMKNILIKALNRGIKKIIDRNNLDEVDILIAVIVGNTIMLHTLLGLRVENIIYPPCNPLFTNELETSPNKINFKMNKKGVVNILPPVSGPVGADVIADILAVDLGSPQNKWELLIDIGTNAEIVLGNGNKFFVCSAAAGPALEGANITYGVGGIQGAIAKYKLQKENIQYVTIGNRKPLGICGSGLIDIVAELYKNNFLTKNGDFHSKDQLSFWQQERIVEYKDSKAYKVLTKKEGKIEKDILLFQKDIREFQLAKAAILAGIKILLKEAKINYKRIDNAYLVGGFGSYLTPQNACVIGLIPKELEDKISKIGNSAIVGAQMYLKNKLLKHKIRNIKQKLKHIKLSSHNDFQLEFMKSMEF